MTDNLAWHYDLAGALNAAREKRRLILADFSKEH
jgi:hypothetical protein